MSRGSRNHTKYVFNPSMLEREVLTAIKEAGGIVLTSRDIAQSLNLRSGTILRPSSVPVIVSRINGKKLREGAFIAVAYTGRIYPRELRGYFDSNAIPRKKDGTLWFD